MNIKPIRTKADYDKAIIRINELTKNDPDELPDNLFDELEILTTLADSYEETHFKIEAPDPISAILFRMEQQGLVDKDLNEILGSRSRVSEVLNRKRGLSLTMIRNLHNQLKIPFESLLTEYPLAK